MSILAQFLHRQRTTKPNNPLVDWSANALNDSHPLTTAAANGSALIADSTQTDGFGLGMPQMIPHELGGSRSLGIRSATWVTIAEWKHPLINPAAVVTCIARVERRTAATTTSVQVRVVDIDNSNAVVGTGVLITADLLWHEETFAIGLNAAAHHYELQIEGGNAAADVFATGRIECYAA
jgi:hypothetical protein